MSWITYTVYNFADDLHWPELGILLESIDYHEAARKASFLGSMCEDPLMAAIHFERRFDALMKYVINSQEHPIGKIKDFFDRVEFEIRGSCHYLVSTYFFCIENIPQDISCDTRDVLVQYIDSAIKTDIPDESDATLVLFRCIASFLLAENSKLSDSSQIWRAARNCSRRQRIWNY